MQQKFVIDTNFFISGFQTLPSSYKDFAKIYQSLGIEVYIPVEVKNELRFYVQREILPYIKVIESNEKKFQSFMKELYRVTANLPQKPDLKVIFTANNLDATIVSSDLKLLETAEKIGLKTLTNSAFVRLLAKEVKDSSEQKLLENLQNKLFAEEIRYSISSTNRYDPVKRIKKIFDTAISVATMREEEEKVETIDMKETHAFSIQALQLKQLLLETKEDLRKLEEDFKKEKYTELEIELSDRVREITDYLVDWKLAVEEIEDHPIYEDALVVLAKLQYLLIICLVEKKRLDIARVYMDKLMMILFQNSSITEQFILDVHLLRMVILLLSGQMQRLTSYFTPAFHERCIQNQREDIEKITRIIILLTVILTRGEIEEEAITEDFESIEFVNQLGFKFMELEKLHKALLMFEQSFYLAVNNEHKGLAIASLEYIKWLHYTGFKKATEKVYELYNYLVKKYPDLTGSYKLELELETSAKVLKNYITEDFINIEKAPKEIHAPLYCIGTTKYKSKQKSGTLIRVMNWATKCRIGIVDEKGALKEKAELGTIFYLIKGNIKVSPVSTYIKRKYKIELLLELQSQPEPIILTRSSTGWEIPLISKGA